MRPQISQRVQTELRPPSITLPQPARSTLLFHSTPWPRPHWPTPKSRSRPYFHSNTRLTATSFTKFSARETFPQCGDCLDRRMGGAECKTKFVPKRVTHTVMHLFGHKEHRVAVCARKSDDVSHRLGPAACYLVFSSITERFLLAVCSSNSASGPHRLVLAEANLSGKENHTAMAWWRIYLAGKEWKAQVSLAQLEPVGVNAEI